jgi:hypothetical protein
VVSDYTSKLFDMGRNGVAWYGQAFLQGRSLGGWLSDFKARRINGDVDHLAAALSAYIATQYDAQFPLPAPANPSPGAPLTPPPNRPLLGLLIAGYDDTGVGKILKIEFPDSRTPTQLFTTRRTGATWAGETDVISRLVMGFDPRIRNTLPFQNLEPNIVARSNIQLQRLQYNIPFDALMMQDGIDFALSLVRITVEMQRFAHGTIGDQTAVPGVGGSVDILAITPFELQWVNRKRLDWR